MVRQSFSHGRSKAVAVEVKKTCAPVAPTRTFATPSTHAPAALAGDAAQAPPPRPAVLHRWPRRYRPECSSPTGTADRGQGRAEPGTGARAGPAPEPVAAAPAVEAPIEPASPVVAIEPMAAAPAAPPRPGPNMTAPPRHDRAPT